MDKIYQCGNNFAKLINTKYHFTISVKRRIQQITLDFQIEDFRHASGLHYIDDIAIERDPQKIIQAILDNNITDALLNKSSKYKSLLKDTGSIEERISEMCQLEEYLDKSDFIRIYQMQDFSSQIKADYFIEALSKNTSVYIFLRKRLENDNYVMVSFFKKYRTYKGINSYWMLKEKEINGIKTELYRHPSYCR